MRRSFKKNSYQISCNLVKAWTQSCSLYLHFWRQKFLWEPALELASIFKYTIRHFIMLYIKTKTYQNAKHLQNISVLTINNHGPGIRLIKFKRCRKSKIRVERKAVMETNWHHSADEPQYRQATAQMKVIIDKT